MGVTNDLVRRIHEHRKGAIEGFSQRYGVKRLVYFEEYATIPLTIQREHNIKHWPRRWKLELAEGQNPTWRDLWSDIIRRRLHGGTAVWMPGSSPGMTMRLKAPDMSR